ncbi:TPA: transcriptional regulator [Klebsiella pneumoniae]|nr:transcriptional regulator [Klebsiella pneumoniae]
MIASKVIYDSETGSLSCSVDSHNEEKKITKTANRILNLLIESHGHVVEREHLLEQVWESHGLVSSNGSLNQYISILRKTLTSLTDIEDIIVSIPKVGFIISHDIEILQLGENKTLTNETCTETIKKTSLSTKILLLAITAALILNILLFIYPDDNPRYKTAKNLYTIDKCQIQAWANMPENVNETITKAISEIVPELLEQCSKHPATIFVSLQKRNYQIEDGIVFLSFCPLRENKITHCNNFYHYKWKQ